MCLRRAAPRAVVSSLLCYIAVSSSPPVNAARLTLDAVQTMAEERAPRLLVAREAIGVARAELAAADPSVPDNPQLELSAGPRLASEHIGVALDVALTQSVFLDGQRGARLAAAKKAVLAAEAEVQVARWSLHADLHQAFESALVARERVALQSEVEGFQRRLAEIARKKERAGEIAPLDARLTEIELIEARQDTLLAESEYRIACLRLAALVGWDAPDLLEPEGALEAPPLVALDALKARALEREPERRLKAALVTLARARLEAERRDAGVLPAFGIAFRHEGGIGAEPSISTVQGIVSLPLPFSQRNRGGIARARAELRQTEVEHAAHERLLLARVAELHAALAAAIERAAVFGEDIVPRVGESLTLLERGYAIGELELSETIVARERFVAARLDELDARAAALSARAELERLLGSDLEEVTR